VLSFVDGSTTIYLSTLLRAGVGNHYEKVNGTVIK